MENCCNRLTIEQKLEHSQLVVESWDYLVKFAKIHELSEVFYREFEQLDRQAFS